jgi:hypothetical protein
LIEVDPGGGAAVAYLAAQLAHDPADTDEARDVQVTLIQAPGVVSQSLTCAIEQFNQVGTCHLVHGFAQDIGTLLTEPVDVISASALLHEVYSYGGGYAGLHTVMRTLPTVLAPGGFFAYRDVYAVDGPSLHERVIQSYNSRAWLTFLRLFAPQYLAEGTHPYHHAGDELVARQNSRIVPVSEPATCTPRRSGCSGRSSATTSRSGITCGGPGPSGSPRSWMVSWPPTGSTSAPARSACTTDSETRRPGCPGARRMMLVAMSEPYANHHTIDSDIFDLLTDVALIAFLDAAEQGDTMCRQVWESWLLREGRETYAYMTLDQMLTAFAVHSAEVDTDTALMPVQAGDIRHVERHYYNRFLTKRRANPLPDAKQLILFRNVPRGDVAARRQAFDAVQG